MSEAEEYQDEDDEYQPQPSRNAAAYTSPLDRYGSQISVLTNPSDAIYQFELNLRCLKENDNGQLIKIGGKKWKPMMNDEGINKLLSCIRPIVNPMVPLSNIDDHEVGILMRQLGYNFVDAFAIHKEYYGLTTMTRRMVFGETMAFCYLFLKRPYMEGDKKFFGKITQEIKSTQEIKRPSGGSVLNPLNWGKGK